MRKGRNRSSSLSTVERYRGRRGKKPASPKPDAGTSLRREVLERISRGLLVFIALVALAMIFLGLRTVVMSQVPQEQEVGSSGEPMAQSDSSEEPLSKHVGIVAGHYESDPQAIHDPGAICDDGLLEVDINLSIAQRVVALLRAAGYRVDLLGEFDPDIHGYLADAFVALHSDSCMPGASGFKVARVTHSAVPEKEDRLVACLWDEYEDATGLERHEFSITPDMQQYHALRKIAMSTPGAIIEMGFMLEDRHILLDQPDLAAQGIANGIICFLEGEDDSY